MHYLETTIDYLDKNVIQLTITFILIFLFLIARSVVRKVVRRQAKKADLAYPRELYVKKLTITILFIFFTTIIGMIWGISLRGLSVYFASIFTVIGIGLFATWSILSNLTASVVLYFFFPYRIGDTIKIVDGDNSVEGEIVDITLFNIRIKAENELLYSYPNNLAIQKPISSKNHDF